MSQEKALELAAESALDPEPEVALAPEVAPDFFSLSPALTQRALSLGPRLISLGATIGVAESLTGGLVATTLTYTPGSSAVFLGGVTAYANSVKEKVVGVDPTILETQGAVSQLTALAMAQGIKKLLGAEIGLATTGIAGPDGGSAEKPVGLYHVAAMGLGRVVSAKNIFSGHRQQIAEAAALSVLDLLEEIITNPSEEFTKLN
ncbi:MAG: CinA family protein [Deltaproteobacteria bacterium]|nr:CinA family protein [Deltaproteobacteria bacterium]